MRWDHAWLCADWQKRSTLHGNEGGGGAGLPLFELVTSLQETLLEDEWP